MSYANLHVSVDHSYAVEVLDSLNYLSSIESGVALWEYSLSGQVVEQFSSSYVLCH